MFYFVSPTQVAAKTAVPKTPPSINTSCDKKQRRVWKPPAPGTEDPTHATVTLNYPVPQPNYGLS